MTKSNYNGFTNKTTWLANHHYGEAILGNVKNGETIKSNLEYVKEAIKDRVDDLVNHTDVPGIVEDIINAEDIINKINWLELENYYTKELKTIAK